MYEERSNLVYRRKCSRCLQRRKASPSTVAAHSFTSDSMVETEEAVRSWANFLIEAAGIFSAGETWTNVGFRYHRFHNNSATCAIAVSSVKGSEGNTASRSLPSTSLALFGLKLI